MAGPFGPDLGADAEVIQRHWLPLPGDVCLDVGTGPGYWAMEAALRGAFCYAFEPDPYAVAVSCQLFRGRLASRVCLMPIPLWWRSGTATFRNGRVMDDSPNNGSEMVATLTLDDFARAALSRMDWVNIDAEGAELGIVRGGRGALTLYRPKLVIEVHANVDRAVLEGELYGLGYRLGYDSGFLIGEAR